MSLEGEKEELALWDSVPVYVYRPSVSLQAYGRTQKRFSLAPRGSMCRRAHKSASSWGSICVGCLLCWSRSDLEQPGARPCPTPLATFPLLAPACWVLGSRKQENREVSWKWGQGHGVVPQSDPEGSRRAELGLEELGVLATRFHFSQPQAWFKSHCVCRQICLSGKQAEARS